MSLRGGYQIIDLERKNLAVGSAVTVAGIYDKIEGTDKTILVTGVVVSDVEYHDAFVTPIVNASNFEFVLYGYTFSITSEDAVSITAIE